MIIFREGSALANFDRFQTMSARRRGFRPRSLLRQMERGHSFSSVLQGSVVWLAPCERIECARSAHEDSSVYIYIYIYIHVSKNAVGVWINEKSLDMDVDLVMAELCER